MLSQLPPVLPFLRCSSSSDRPSAHPLTQKERPPASASKRPIIFLRPFPAAPILFYSTNYSTFALSCQEKSSILRLFFHFFPHSLQNIPLQRLACICRSACRSGRQRFVLTRKADGNRRRWCKPSHPQGWALMGKGGLTDDPERQYRFLPHPRRAG